MLAAQGGHLDCLRLLVAKQADVAARRSDGATALRLAVRSDHAAAVGELVRAGALAYEHRAILAQEAIAAKGARAAAGRDGSGANARRRRGSATIRSGPPLFEAARHDAGRAAAELLGAAEDPHAHLTDGRTPLMVAATFGSESVVSVLLEAGADPAALTVSKSFSAAPQRNALQMRLRRLTNILSPPRPTPIRSP